MVVDLLRLKAERIAKGYSQEDMARLLGWKHRSTYVRKENGYADIGANELIKIAEVLGYSVNDMHIFFKDNVHENEH